MRCMNRNKSIFYYALYVDKVEIKDEYGNATGEYKLIYGNPVKCSANISASKGEADTRQFGENEGYDKVIVTDNTSPKFDIYTILWIDTVPQLDADGVLARNEADEVITPYNYIVKKVAQSLNSVSIAISKVEVSA